MVSRGIPVSLDRHILGAVLFTGTVMLNHRLGLALTSTELFILAAVLGIDQVTTLIRALKDPPDAPPPVA